MKQVHAAVVAGLLALAACTDGTGSTEQAAAKQGTETGAVAPAELAAKAAAKSGDTAPYYTDLPLNEFMPHVMQYAGDGVWKRQGYVSDEKGEHSLFPKNDEEWEDAESASLALAEMTNTLLIPGRRVPEPDWDKAVIEVRKVALQAAKAAEQKDADAFFAAGGALDEACDVCHVRYDPTFKR